MHHSETILLVLYVYIADSKILRTYLESKGYFDILPPNEKCILLIQVLRPNLPNIRERLFPMKLEILFPTMYPRNHLIRLNHEALVDCQQTRLICVAFEEL